MQLRGYRVVESCASCLHALFDGKPWGGCRRESYIHGKHGKRLMPAHVSMTCEHYTRDPRATQVLGPYAAEPWLM